MIEVWDSHPADGPSVGLMQVKPWVWQYLVPAADAYEPAGNIRLGVAVLAHLIERYGSWERAIAEGYHPGVASERDDAGALRRGHAWPARRAWLCRLNC